MVRRRLTFGKLVGDKGYISKDIFSKLFVDGIQLITKLRNNMKGQIMTLGDKILLRKRAIDTINDELKNIVQIEHSRHRSVTGFTVNLMAGLAAYSFFPKKPMIAVERIEPEPKRAYSAVSLLVRMHRTHVKIHLGRFDSFNVRGADYLTSQLPQSGI